MLITLALALSTEAPLVDRRADFQRFSARLEQRLAAVCRPAETNAFFAGVPATRFVYLDGVGAVFLLPPRSLPNPPPSKTDQSTPEIAVSSAPSGPQVLVFRGQRPGDLAELEARIRETRKEAERMRAQADAAFADAERELMPGISEPNPSVPFPMPWTLFLDDEIEDARSPDQVEKDVREALLQTILEDSPPMKSLLPSDSIAVSVELVYRPQPWVRARPARTITVRAEKADLDALATGKISRAEMLSRVQTKTY